ncbi:hypothetical protein KOR42_22870 [Thalassoglobus neptunius]|uniref:Uncharacterized protein n=1 Tax=Thalassoglobus neptunius TaxID=1938619 RepID=A0A5C5X7H8_9PLAN|nr:hypothetical protein [Thalassoglobus neptunius]TWT58900.1 hypothetical protein KOR42_22870 [Thalassoglobus neptunius]
MITTKFNFPNAKRPMELIRAFLATGEMQLTETFGLKVHGDPVPEIRVEEDRIQVSWKSKAEITARFWPDPDIQRIDIWSGHAEIHLVMGASIVVRWDESESKSSSVSGDRLGASAVGRFAFSQESVSEEDRVRRVLSGSLLFYTAPEGRQRRKGWSKRRCLRAMQADSGYEAIPPILMAILYRAVWAVIKEMAQMLFEALNGGLNVDE